MIELFISKTNSPFYNLAMEQYLVYDYKTENRVLFLWQNENTIVIGRNQNIYEQVKIDKAKKDKVNVVRRNTGGGTVFQDLGNVCFSIIENNSEQDKFSINRVLEPVVEFLQNLGLNAEFIGKNDIKIDGYKVSGNAELKTKEKTLTHGTLLYDVNLDQIEKYLLLNTKKLESKKIKSNVSMVKNIINLLPKKIKVDKFIEQLIAFFKTKNEVIFKQDSDIDLEKINEIIKRKYDSWDWNYGKSTSFQNVNEKYFEKKGVLEAQYDIYEGTIKRIQFSGDFMGYLGTDELENKLIGKNYDKDVVKNILNQCDLKSIFGEGFTADDILEVVF